MSSEEVEVVAVIAPALGKEERTKEVLTKLASEVLVNEKDCLSYQFFEQYDGEDSNKIVVIEKYASQAALDAHYTTSHFQSAVKSATEESLLAEPLDIKKIKAFAGFYSR